MRQWCRSSRGELRIPQPCSSCCGATPSRPEGGRVKPLLQTPKAIADRRYLARKRRNRIASDPASLRLVEQIAKRIHNRLPTSFDLGDLVQEGMVALVRAAARYDPDAHAGTPFPAFALQAVTGAILESCRRHRYIENTRCSIDEPDRRSPHGHGPEDGERDLRFAGEAAQALAGIATQPSAPDAIDKARLYARVSDAIAWLPPQQREVLRLSYSAEEPHILFVSRRLGISREEAEAAHAAAIAGLRARLTGGPCERAELQAA
jgi:RNA polymerase sigma factor (sigma-70 family)